MAETRITNDKTGGQKGRKPEAFSMLPWDQLAEVARLYAFGATKYAPHNWRKGFDWSLSFDSMMRHATAFWNGESTDDETQCSHLASVVFHALALMYFEQAHTELDDRPPTGEQRVSRVSDYTREVGAMLTDLHERPVPDPWANMQAKERPAVDDS